ncbi:MAG: hypothetical protein HQL12_07820, partial [Candidatus Omnitrophica bacterium]|nr:hypothetical protein [Candidatus Omnitrophota bacterium]
IVAKDFSGFARCSTPTIGAYEYAGSSVTPSSPVVAITSPSNGSSLTAGTNITITTTASEANGTISNISLYNGAGVLLGSSSSSPYNYVMSNAAAGSYTFTAVAKDASGVSTTSSPITLTVTPAPILPSPPV